MNRKDWQILAGVLVGGVGGIATGVVFTRWVGPESISGSGFIVAGAIVLIAMLVIQFIRLRRRRVGDGR